MHSSLPSINDLGERCQLRSLNQQTQAMSLLPQNDNTVLASSDTAFSNSTIYSSLSTHQNNNPSPSSSSSEDPLTQCNRELRSFSVAKEKAERYQKLTPPTDPPPMPEISIEKIAQNKNYLKEQAFNLEHNDLSSTNYREYWDYLNARLFKEIAIPEKAKLYQLP